MKPLAVELRKSTESTQSMYSKCACALRAELKFLRGSSMKGDEAVLCSVK